VVAVVVGVVVGASVVDADDCAGVEVGAEPRIGEAEEDLLALLPHPAAAIRAAATSAPTGIRFTATRMLAIGPTLFHLPPIFWLRACLDSLRPGGDVKPRIHVITIAVDDLERSLAFYRSLGLESAGVVAEEFPGDDEMAAGAIALFQLERGLILAVFPRKELAKDAKVPAPVASSGLFSIGHAVGSRDEVDALLNAAEKAGATVTVRAYDRPFGVYSGYFQDPDGHLWEILFNESLEDL
jgi:catechol 2,3-dioxygenase-like lactoylglutathione lyase family enzyme